MSPRIRILLFFGLQGSGSNKIKEDTRVSDFNKRFGDLDFLTCVLRQH